MKTLKEDPIEYRKTTRQYISDLIGEDDCEKLYSFYHYDNTILSATEQDYISIGLSKKNAKMLYLAKNIRATTELSDQIKSSRDAYAHFAYLGTCNVEHFVVLPMNRQNCVIGKPITISTGGVSGTVVDTKIIFQKLLHFKRINGLICAHNHPSGNLSPSSNDVELTKKIAAGALLLDLKLFDHLIVTEHGYYSFADEGHM